MTIVVRFCSLKIAMQHVTRRRERAVDWNEVSPLSETLVDVA